MVDHCLPSSGLLFNQAPDFSGGPGKETYTDYIKGNKTLTS